jgi:hypothetical protein
MKWNLNATSSVSSTEKPMGEIVIKNESPHVSGGVHEVVDNVHIGRSAFKETVAESAKGI